MNILVKAIPKNLEYQQLCLLLMIRLEQSVPIYFNDNKNNCL